MHFNYVQHNFPVRYAAAQASLQVMPEQTTHETSQMRQTGVVFALM